MTATPLHIGLGLNALAHRPGQDGRAPAQEAFQYAVLRADAAAFDFVTLDDVFGEERDGGRSRVDAVLFASALAPLTTDIGLIPVTTVSLREPFHLATALATLDYVSAGRAGWQVDVPPQAYAARLAQHSGSGVLGVDYASRDAVLEDCADGVEVARRLWDSWEDDAIIRDAATGRFIDRDKLHYIAFKGATFSVLGPSIVPRPPQGQPVVAIRADDDATLALAVAQADLVLFGVDTIGETRASLARLQAASAAAKRPTPRAYADLVIAFGQRPGSLPDALPAPLFRGGPAELVGYLGALAGHGVDGVRLHPLDLTHDLATLTDNVLPALREAQLMRPRHAHSTLRARLGLPDVPNRYAHTGALTQEPAA